MDSITVTIYSMLALCVILILVSFSSKLQYLFSFVFRACLGMISFSILNMIFASTNFYIASNLFTLCISGFLGFYGIVALVISNIIL